MRVIVTGGLGFIGSAFVNSLKEKLPTCEVVVLDKMTYAANPDNIKHTVKYIQKDICDVTPEDLGEYDYLVHFAAESHVDNSIKDGKPFIRTNVEGTFNLLECARECKSLKKFIHISTDEVYGDMDDIDKSATATEDSPLIGSSYYSSTKASSDLLVLAAHRTFGLPYIITRTCNNYGSHQHKEKFIPTIMRSIKEGNNIPVYGDGSNVREWIHVNDNVNVIYELMTGDWVNEIFNIGSGETYTNLEIIETIGKIMGKIPKYQFVEDRLGHDKRYELDSSKCKKEIGQFYIKQSFKNFLTDEVKKLNL